MSRKPWDEYWLDIADMVATRATCPRLHVGAVLVVNNRILSTGYNGSLPGAPHCEDVGCDISDGHCVRTTHAEANAWKELPWPIRIADWKWQRENLRMYVTHTPCAPCWARIPDGLSVKWRHDYPNNSK